MNGAILLRPEHRDMARPHFRCQRWRAIFLEAADAFLNALQPVERAFQTILCRTADRGARWLLAPFEALIQGAAYDAGLCGLGISDQARVMDLVAAQTKIGGRHNRVVIINAFPGTIMCTDDVAALLRGVIFIGEAAFGGGLDFQRIGLCAVGGRHEIIMGGFGV
ncbi:MAG: hypothetical protein NXH84_07355, partial [Rhodobacteraceae bacterium]|nr:hypothetical protein [Paracoccaceae bacterium]